MIPPEKSAAVTRALHEAFGATAFEDIQTIKDLALSMVFRIVVRGSPFLLKISSRTNDPARHYGCMNAAAEAGLAPRVWYTSPEDRVSITDFVNTVPLPRTDALLRIPPVLRRLHGLPPFAGVPHQINNTCMYLRHEGPARDAFLQKFQAAKVLPREISEELFAVHAQLAAAYPLDDADMVSSHNDLFKPDNMLFDGHRVWLIDWEAAFLNDRYADLAVVANQLVTNAEDELVFLREYFGAPPDSYQQARFHLMQQLAHVFYAMAYFFMSASGKPIDLSGTVPDFGDFQRRLWAGEIDLSDKDVKPVYARIHLERLLYNVQQARYSEALRIVSRSC